MGTIDARGTFRLTDKVPVLEASRRGDRRVRGTVVSFAEPLQCYEFRSGRLIPGTMMPDGEFVPEAGGTIIRFDDYRYGKGRHIWNLPGYFKKKDAADAAGWTK